MLAVLSLLLIGVAVGRLRLLPDGAAAALDAAVITIALPGLVLVEIATAPLGIGAVVPVAVAWGTLAVLAALVWLVARVLRLDRRTTGTLLLMVPLGNTAFLGYPAVTALLGGDRLGLAVVYDQFGSFLALITYAAVIATRFGEPPTGRGGGALMRLVRFPPFAALLLALAFRPFGLPDLLAQVGDLLGDTVVPLAMLAIGMRLELRSLTHRPALLALGLGLRMALAPWLVLLAAVALGAQGVEWEVSTLQAAMPPMVTAAVVAADARLDERLAVALAGVGVLVAMVSLPLWARVVAG